MTVRDGVVVAFDQSADRRSRVVRLGDDEVVRPGARDDHLHLRAMAAARCSIDVSACADNRAVVDALRSGRRSSSGWWRGWGYDEALLGEPTLTAGDLDVVGGPLVLHHRTGHAAILNTEAMRLLGIRDRPDGVLVDEHERLAGVPRLDPGELDDAVLEVCRHLAGQGVVAVTDATHTNDLAGLEALADAVSQASEISVTAMVGADRLDGSGFGSVAGGVRVGHAKVMPTDSSLDDVGDLVEEAHRRGFPVAVHVMDIETLAVTLAALGTSPPPMGTVDRLEHCAMALPEQLDQIADLGLHVATQPSFVTRRAAKYRSELSEVEHEWLWPLRSLMDRGVSVSFSSDGPVVPAVPDQWLAAATQRPIGDAESVSPERAFAASIVAPLSVGSPIDTLVRFDGDGRRRDLFA